MKNIFGNYYLCEVEKKRCKEYWNMQGIFSFAFVILILTKAIFGFGALRGGIFHFAAFQSILDQIVERK